MYRMLEGTDRVSGLRHMEGLKVRMNAKDLTARDLILGVEFDNMTCEQAVEEFEKREIEGFLNAAWESTSK